MKHNAKNKDSMEKEIREIIGYHCGGTHEGLQEATKKILTLFSVSCECDACKQQRIDRDYMKYLELNKNVKHYY